jgi:hypothetical protein
VPSADCSSVTYSCKKHYAQPTVEVKCCSKQLFFSCFRLGVQHKPITPAVQPTPHIRAPAAVIDLIAVADVKA